MMDPCHGSGPGSSPGRRTTLFSSQDYNLVHLLACNKVYSDLVTIDEVWEVMKNCIEE